MQTIHLEDAVARIPDGARLAIGEFMAVGTPERLMAATAAELVVPDDVSRDAPMMLDRQGEESFILLSGWPTECSRVKRGNQECGCGSFGQRNFHGGVSND